MMRAAPLLALLLIAAANAADLKAGPRGISALLPS
jgi:hypothetical protein